MQIWDLVNQNALQKDCFGLPYATKCLMTAICLESELSFAEHSTEEGVSVAAGGEETVGSFPPHAVCGGGAGLWPCLADVFPRKRKPGCVC